MFRLPQHQHYPHPYHPLGTLGLCTMIGLCVPMVACVVSATTPIAPETLAAQIQTKTAPLILDVRSPQEYAAGHIPGAMNIEFRELEGRLAELPIAPDEAIVVYCERGVRAGVAEQTLVAVGFTAVLSLQGDMAAWRQQGRPIAQGAAAP